MAASGTGDEESAKHVLVLGSCDVGAGKFQIVLGLCKEISKRLQPQRSGHGCSRQRQSCGSPEGAWS